MTSKKLTPIRAGSLRQQVQERVFEAILAGHFLPGDPLRELDLARDLRVSQATVREALLRLESTGLVVRVPNKPRKKWGTCLPCRTSCGSLAVH